MDLSIIIPLYNFEDKVLTLYNKIIDEFNNVDLNIIFINNGSSDLTIEELKSIHKKNNKSVKIINFSKKYHIDIAIKEGILHSKSKYTAIFDVNSNISLKYLNKMYDTIIKSQEYDFVCVNKVLTKINIIKKTIFNVVDKLFNSTLNTEFTNCIIFKKDILNVINQNNINVYDVLELGYNGYIYIVKTNKSQKMKNILQNNIENCIKYIGIINLFISIIVFLIYITLSFLKIIKFNYINIFLFFIMLFLSLFSILLSFWMKRNNISSNYLKRNYIIKELIGLDNDYL